MIDLTCVRKRLVLWLSLVPLALAVSGCQTISYYKQAIQGQYRVLSSRRSIQDLVQDPKAPATLKERLQLVLQLREFADQQLKLPANTHYLQYADVHRRYVVWNVHAAPEFSLEPKTWHYPIVGQ